MICRICKKRIENGDIIYRKKKYLKVSEGLQEINPFYDYEHVKCC